MYLCFQWKPKDFCSSSSPQSIHVHPQVILLQTISLKGTQWAEHIWQLLIPLDTSKEQTTSTQSSLCKGVASFLLAIALQEVGPVFQIHPLILPQCTTLFIVQQIPFCVTQTNPGPIACNQKSLNILQNFTLDLSYNAIVLQVIMLDADREGSRGLNELQRSYNLTFSICSFLWGRKKTQFDYT